MGNFCRVTRDFTRAVHTGHVTWHNRRFWNNVALSLTVVKANRVKRYYQGRIWALVIKILNRKGNFGSILCVAVIHRSFHMLEWNDLLCKNKNVFEYLL